VSAGSSRSDDDDILFVDLRDPCKPIYGAAASNCTDDPARTVLPQTAWPSG
jgi:hypothetical protein